MEGLDVVPVLLEEGDEEIDSHHGVLTELFVGEAGVADGDAHAQNLLKLELDVGLQLVALLLDVVVMGDQGRELTGLVETGTQQTGNLGDQDLGGQEGIVLTSELLDELLVLVELLEILDGLEVNTELAGLLAMDSISENADLHAGTGDVRHLDGTGETLITLGVIILEADLKIDGLHELAGLSLAPLQDFGQSRLEGISVQLRHG